ERRSRWSLYPYAEDEVSRSGDSDPAHSLGAFFSPRQVREQFVRSDLRRAGDHGCRSALSLAPDRAARAGISLRRPQPRLPSRCQLHDLFFPPALLHRTIAVVLLAFHDRRHHAGAVAAAGSAGNGLHRAQKSSARGAAPAVVERRLHSRFGLDARRGAARRRAPDAFRAAVYRGPGWRRISLPARIPARFFAPVFCRGADKMASGENRRHPDSAVFLQSLARRLPLPPVSIELLQPPRWRRARRPRARPRDDLFHGSPHAGFSPRAERQAAARRDSQWFHRQFYVGLLSKIGSSASGPTGHRQPNSRLLRSAQSPKRAGTARARAVGRADPAVSWRRARRGSAGLGLRSQTAREPSRLAH